MQDFSIVLPAKNESTVLTKLLSRICGECPDAEVILVDDGSTDSTARIAPDAGARVISHPYSMGNGAAVKTGARAASGRVLN